MAWWMMAVFVMGALAATYQNPVWSGDFADPFVLLNKGNYYAYATSYHDAGADPSINIPSLMSEGGSLTDWKYMGDALPVLPPWAEANAGLTWAPAVLARNGTFKIGRASCRERV